VATVAHQGFPEIRKDGADEVIEATIHLIEEELSVAERLERKAGEQWQFVALAAPLAISGALTAAGVKGVGFVWIAVLVAASLATLGLLVWSMWAGSAMADVKSVKGVNPDVLDKYLNELVKKDDDVAEARMRAALARDLVEVARSRAAANEERIGTFNSVRWRARITFVAAVAVLSLATLAVMVNA
jgi:hypothetical protein